MSGLIGFVGFPPDQLDRIEKQITSQLCRFAWNTWDWWSRADRNIALGRVDIGVFNPKPQPVASTDGQVVVLLSGELYKTDKVKQELEAQGCHFIRGDDPEIVLNAYLKDGARCVARFEGAFHLVVYDQRSQELFIANDRFGLRPLYWTQYQGKFAFAPETKVLLTAPAFERKLELVAIAEYMRFQHLLGDKTFFQGISLLPSASILRYDLADKRLTITSYWSFADIPSLDRKTLYTDVVKEAARLFEGAIQRLSGGSHRVGLYLSGGLDSRLIAGCLAKHRSSFATITYGDKNSIDVLLARRVATLLGSQHHFCEFPDGRWVLQYADLHLDLTEGYHSWIHAHGMSTLAQARSLFDVNLTGWGVDTGLGGYLLEPLLGEAVDNWAFECYLFHLYNQEYTWPGLTEAEEHTLYTEKYRAQMQGLAFESLCTEARKLGEYSFDQRAEYFKLLNHNRRLTQNYVVFNSSHFENRFPGYDYQLFDFVFSSPLAWRANRRLEQDVIEYISPRLALIPQAKDGLLFTRRQSRRLAHHIVTRLKQRVNRHIAPIFAELRSLYADYENWLRHELREWAESLLLDGRMASRGMFNQDFVRSLLNRHFSGRELHTIGKIAPLMTFEMMLRRFYD